MAMERRDIMRQAFFDALVDLLAERSFSSIKVSDIAARCGVCERTFYNYFPSKVDLLHELCTSNLEKTVSMLPKGAYQEGLARTLAYLRDNQDIFRALFASLDGSESIVGPVIERGCEFYASYHDKFTVDLMSDECLGFLLHYHMAGACHCIERWVCGGCTMSSDELALSLTRAMPSELQRALGVSGRVA